MLCSELCFELCCPRLALGTSSCPQLSQAYLNSQSHRAAVQVSQSSCPPQHDPAGPPRPAVPQTVPQSRRQSRSPAERTSSPAERTHSSAEDHSPAERTHSPTEDPQSRRQSPAVTGASRICRRRMRGPLRARSPADWTPGIQQTSGAVERTQFLRPITAASVTTARLGQSSCPQRPKLASQQDSSIQAAEIGPSTGQTSYIQQPKTTGGVCNSPSHYSLIPLFPS